MGSVTEEVYSQLVAHAVVTLVVGELNKRDHLLERSEGFDALLVVPGFGDCLADLFETGWIFRSDVQIITHRFYVAGTKNMLNNLFNINSGLIFQNAV